MSLNITYSQIILETAILDMYSEYGSMFESRMAFDQIICNFLKCNYLSDLNVLPQIFLKKYIMLIFLFKKMRGCPLNPY